jgi:hypothetical protein
MLHQSDTYITIHSRNFFILQHPHFIFYPTTSTFIPTIPNYFPPPFKVAIKTTTRPRPRSGRKQRKRTTSQHILINTSYPCNSPHLFPSILFPSLFFYFIHSFLPPSQPSPPSNPHTHPICFSIHHRFPLFAILFFHEGCRG